ESPSNAVLALPQVASRNGTSRDFRPTDPPIRAQQPSLLEMPGAAYSCQESSADAHCAIRDAAQRDAVRPSAELPHNRGCQSGKIQNSRGWVFQAYDWGG